LKGMARNWILLYGTCGLLIENTCRVGTYVVSLVLSLTKHETEIVGDKQDSAALGSVIVDHQERR
jgi:hypothetical protein